MAAVSPLNSEQLSTALGALVESGLAYRRGAGSNTRYVFKHALVQDAAYNSLLKSTRVRYHQRVADALVQRFPGIAGGQPEVVAHHYTEAGAIEKALSYWHAAGVQARERSADREAIAHLTRGLELVERLPLSPERDRAELELQITLGPALRATRGYTGAGVEQAFSRARELAEQLGDKANLLPALWGLWSFHMVQAHHQTSCELAERCLELATELDDSGHIAQAHRAYGTARFWVGDFGAAKMHNDEGARLYDRDVHASYTLAYGIDVGVGCLAWSAWATWYLGYPDEALDKARAALRLAENLSHPFSIGLAHCWLAALHSFRCENDELQHHAEAAVRLAEEHGIAQWLWFGSVFLGRALSEKGEPEKGIARMRSGVRGWLGMGARTEMPHFSALLAEAHLEIGNTSEAAALLAEGLGYVAETSESYFESELYRLRGVVNLSSDRQAAERDFQRAVEISHAGQSRSLELRAAVSLARLLRSDGRAEEAKAIVAPLYAEFSEGWRTRDLVEARELLGVS
jgi:predicted ATPase